MLKIRMICVFLSIANLIFAEDKYPLLKDIIPPTPNAAAFARYGEYPVSFSTGVPDIEIPLYELKRSGFQLPITLSYHASGIKVEDIASSVGLGWVLNAGGVITRSIRGKADAWSRGNAYINSVSQVNQFINNGWGYEMWESLLTDVTDNDTESDQYYYNFNGKAGLFRYNSETNNILTIPYSPLKIEQISSKPDSGYKITDTDGTKYYFSVCETTSTFCSSIMAVTTAWYLSSIVLSNSKDSIRFDYKYGTGYTQHIPSETVSSGVVAYFSETLDEGPGSTAAPTETTNYEYNTFRSWAEVSYQPRLLSSIVWGSDSLKLSYSNDRIDLAKERLSGITIKHQNSVVKSIDFSQRLSSRMYLTSIKIDNGNYKFDYNYDNFPAYYTSNLNQYKFQFSEDYWGYFNGRSNKYMIPEAFSIAGYYGAKPFYGDRNPDESFMKHGILKSITYPTGGMTLFDFEANRVPYCYSYNQSEAVVGGLRIKDIINEDSNGDILNTKHYEYSGKSNSSISPRSYNWGQEVLYFYMSNNGHGNISDIQTQEVATSTSIVSLTGRNGCQVFYDTVTEYQGTGLVNSGKTVYQYIESVAPLPNYSFDDDNLTPNSDYPRFMNELYNFDMGNTQPLLSEKTEYKNEEGIYKRVRTTTNNYDYKDMGSFLAGCRLGRRQGISPSTLTGTTIVGFPYENRELYFSYIARYDVTCIRGVYLLTSTTVKDEINNMSQTTSYYYDPSLRTMQPVKKIQECSTSDSYVTEYKYPFDLSSNIYTQMVVANIIDPVIECRDYMGRELLKTTINAYRNENGKFVLDKSSQGKGGNAEERVVYQKYDDYGNLQGVILDNFIKIVYLWGYNSTYPVAKIEGATYDEVKNLLTESYINSLSSNNSISQSTGDYIRSKLSSLNVHITTYIYKPLVGIASITDPNGKKTTYTYDDAGRLIEIIDHNSKPIESYEYNYKH